MGAKPQIATDTHPEWTPVDESASPTTSSDDVVSRIAQAISKAEGSDIPGSLGNRLNNPGNLKLGDLGYGTVDDKTRFGSLSDGLAHLHKQIQAILDGTSTAGYKATDSISQVASRYTGNDNPESWAKVVASELGLKPKDSLATVSASAGDASQWTPVDEGEGALQPTASLASRLMSDPSWGQKVLDDPQAAWYKKVAGAVEDPLERAMGLPTALAATVLAPPSTPSETALAASPYVHTPGVNWGGQAAVAAKRLIADPFMSETAKAADPSIGNMEGAARVALSPLPGAASMIEGVADKIGGEGWKAVPDLVDNLAGMLAMHAVGGEVSNPVPTPGPREAAMNAVRRITRNSIDDANLRPAMQTTEQVSKGLDYFNGKDVHGDFRTGHIDAQGNMTDLAGDPIDPREITATNRAEHSTPNVEALTAVAAKAERATRDAWAAVRDPYAGFSTKFTIPGTDRPASVIELDKWITGRNTELTGKLSLEGLKRAQAQNHPIYGPQLQELQAAKAALNETVSGLSGVDSASIRQRWADVSDLRSGLAKVTGEPGSTMRNEPFAPYASPHGVKAAVAEKGMPQRYGDLDALADLVGKKFRVGTFGDPVTPPSSVYRPRELPGTYGTSGSTVTSFPHEDPAAQYPASRALPTAAKTPLQLGPGTSLETPPPPDTSAVRGASAGLDVQYPASRSLPEGRRSLVTPYRGEPAGSEPTGVMNQGFANGPQPDPRDPLAPQVEFSPTGETTVAAQPPASAEADFQEWLRREVAAAKGGQ